MNETLFRIDAARSPLMDEAIQKSKREKADGWKACAAAVSDYNFLERR